MNNMTKYSKEIIEELYINQNKTRKEICEILKISCKKFCKMIKDYNIYKSKDKIISRIKQSNINTYATGKPQEKIKQTFIKNWGVENPNKLLTIQNKKINTSLERYGESHPNKSKEVKIKISQSNKKVYATGKPQIKQQETFQKKYGYNTPLLIPKIRDKIREGFDSGITQLKDYKTKKKNKSFNKSKPEEEAYQLLLTKFPVEDIERQYRSELYPFNCDFYIKSLDLFIECNFHWTHGKYPYTNTKDPLLEKWETRKDKKFYQKAIEVYTRFDPLKRKIAQQNNLNWIEFFTLTDIYNYIKEL